ncbi:MAG TPA: menaquinone reductase multiheme cytochrome c subunit QrcA [Candidatus Acidoferrales bacterium]|nr:menaquinone reductase multiheme cytochrome c subunit QrcA [Candidatus Acidoferrales bacterium]
MKDHGKLMFLTGITVILLFGWITFPYVIYRPVNQPIQFSHFAHTGDNVGLKCGSCHTFDKDGRFNGIPTIEKCRSCHSKPMGISKDEARLVNEYVMPGREIPWIIYSMQPQSVFFSHSTHVKLAGMDCQTCHFGQAYTRKLRPAYFSRISGYGLDVFGKDLLNFPSTPSRGMRMDDCSNCHHERGVQESCIDCHK